MKLEFDRSMETLANTAPSVASLTRGKLVANTEPGFYEIDLGGVQKFSRLEFTIDNPGYRRGLGREFELLAKQSDGSWRTIHQGHVFGTIYSKTFSPVRAEFVRLKIEAPAVLQFDLFDETL